MTPFPIMNLQVNHNNQHEEVIALLVNLPRITTIGKKWITVALNKLLCWETSAKTDHDVKKSGKWLLDLLEALD